MKKVVYFIAGTLVGAVVMTAGSAIAAEVKQLVGTKVGSVWELNVNGEAVGEVPIINGSSYGPIRQIAQIAGMDVDFEPGKVLLVTTKAGDNVEEVSDGTELLKLQIAHTMRLRDGLVNGRKEDAARLSDMPTEESKKNLEEAIKTLDEGIAKYEAEIAKLEAELAELTK
jgi:hypothetical protein